MAGGGRGGPGTFARLGLWTVPATLACATTALWAMLRLVGTG
ncbi:hypothetical protein P3T37_001135 [Kitasatospora sp. MAA4]|nr:hypothetical protein [Kitasatospora sp. MAA4]MDH6131761.1 hypothetical protein [Kitasatospora sp. MAA4]